MIRGYLFSEQEDIQDTRTARNTNVSQGVFIFISDQSKGKSVKFQPFLSVRKLHTNVPGILCILCNCLAHFMHFPTLIEMGRNEKRNSWNEKQI